MQHPDFRKLLPSKVREYLSQYFTDKIESSELNCYADPMYRLENAVADFRDAEGILPGSIVKEYNKALGKYNRQHPKGWDTENQKAFRR